MFLHRRLARLPLRIFLGLLCTAWLPGCADFRPDSRLPAEADVPAAWSESTSTITSGPALLWWRRFDDPLMSELVEQALQANTGVLGAQAALRAARATREVAAAALQPTVGSSASVQRGSNDGQSTGNLFRAGVDAAWELDVFGANRSALATADASAQASRADLGDVQVSVAAEVGLSYIALRSAQARLAVAETNLLSQRDTLQLTDWRAQAGLLSALETEQARAAAAQTAAQLPALRSSVANARHALAVLTGQPPAALDARLAAVGTVPQLQGEMALSLPAETLRQRADVRAAEQQVLAARGRIASADAARYPDFRLGGSLGLSALTFSGLGSAGLVTSLLASTSWPLWDGGAARARVGVQQAEHDQARATYRGTVLLALREVEDALASLRGDLERLQALQQAADAATLSATLARQRQGSGITDFQNVLETQRSQLAAQDSLAGARGDVGADQVRLFKALGGGWTPDMPPEATGPNAATTAQPSRPR
jgi:outer membrane protein, multidrug efflux system